MSLAILILATGLIFLIADAVMLTTVIKPLFERHIGPRPSSAASAPSRPRSSTSSTWPA
jgi:hypothetical protein